MDSATPKWNWTSFTPVQLEGDPHLTLSRRERGLCSFSPGEKARMRENPATDMANTMTSFETLLYEKRGPVARISFNRPQVLNAYNVRMRDDLSQALSAVADDAEVRALLVTGEGRGFCAGADLTEFGSAETTPSRSATTFTIGTSAKPKWRR